MKPVSLSSLSLVFLVVLCGCSKHSPSERSPGTSPAALPPRLQSHFEQYCDYTGGLGIGFDPSHTYDYQFRQRLKQTNDPELMRLYVLQHLYNEVEWALRDLKAGITRIGKVESRPLTAGEWHEARQRVIGQIDDLATYASITNFATAPTDSLDASWIDELRAQVRGITNAPESSRHAAPSGGQPVGSETN